MKFNTFYACEGLDAKVGIHLHTSGVTLLSFLAQGNSQVKNKAGTVIGYTKRNPDRRHLVDLVLPLCEGATLCRYGSQKAGLSSSTDLTPERLRKLYSKGRNFQFDIAIPTSSLFPNLPENHLLDELVLAKFNLVPVKGRPIQPFIAKN